MAEYIEREAAIMAAMNYTGDGNAQDASQDIAGTLGCIPVADVKPSVKGEWLGDGFVASFRVKRCSCCDQLSPESYYCCNCGADMRGVNNEHID